MTDRHSVDANEPDGRDAVTGELPLPREGIADSAEMGTAASRRANDVLRSSFVLAVSNEPAQPGQGDCQRKRAPTVKVLREEGVKKWLRVFFSWLTSWPVDGERGRLLTRILLCVLAWSAVATIVGKDGTSGGYLFAISVIIAFAALGGYLIRLIRLPPLLGMLLMGFALRNISGIDVGTDLKSSWSSALRSVALVVILLRAGLGLDPGVLKRAKFVILRLAFLPCLFEASVDAALAVGILDMPWTWGFVLGFVIAAVSPAVVVPQLLLLQERGYGLAKGVPTLVIAAASFDDVLAISGFGIALGLIFSNGSLAFNIARGPLELVTGILGGGLVGMVAWFLPSYDRSESHLHRNRVLFLVLAGLTAVFGTRRIHFTGAGALGVLTMAFVASRKWLPDDKKAVAHSMALLWDFAQPMLFGLIGAEIKSSSLTESYVGKAIGVLWIGMAVRVTVSFFSVFGYGLNLKEKAFVALAWLPKATVQAAVGSIAYDTAVKEKGTAKEKKLGLMVLTIAVLVIVITAPIGSVAIYLAGPRLLAKSTNMENDTDSPGRNTAANNHRRPLDGRTPNNTLLVTGV